MTLLSISNNFIYYTILITSSLIVIPFIIGIIWYKYLTPVIKGVFFYVVFSVVGIALANTLGHFDMNNILLGAILTISEALIIITLFLINFNLTRRVIVIFESLFIATFIIISVVPRLEVFQTALLYSVLIISSTAYLLKNIKTNNHNEPNDAFRFFAIGVFMNFSASLLLDISGSNFELFTLRQHMLMGLIRSLFFTIYCLFLGYSIYSCGRKQRKNT